MDYRVVIVLFLEGPALLFFMLPWDSYSKEVELLPDFSLEFLIPGFWLIHRWRASFYIPSLPKHINDQDQKSQIPILQSSPVPFLFVWFQFSERHTCSQEMASEWNQCSSKKESLSIINITTIPLHNTLLLTCHTVRVYVKDISV